jgi:phosphatidylethanolamine-binding protein (PEBP) family uncharacterized protein
MPGGLASVNLVGNISDKLTAYEVNVRLQLVRFNQIDQWSCQVNARKLSAVSTLIFALLLVGCGSSSPSTPRAAREPAIPFISPALISGRVIPAHLKCNVRNVWLPLAWGRLPAHTQELALYMVRFGTPKVAGNGKVNAEVKASAIVVGLKPTLRRLRLGKYPHGAVVGVHSPNDPSASICPPRGAQQDILFRIYALPHKLDLHKGGELVNQMSADALEAGTFIASYKPA